MADVVVFAWLEAGAADDDCGVEVAVPGWCCFPVELGFECPGCACLAFAALFCGGELWRATGHASLLFIAASASAILLGCHWLSAGAPRGLGWLARMGRLSYELYLTHMFVVLAVVAVWRAWIGERQDWNFVAYVPAVVLCVLLASVIERYYSKPIERRLRRRFAGAAERVRPAVGSSAL